jgi:hypothetical protein
MGQQQLLLLVISIVVVAFAVLIAFEAVQEKMKQNEADVILDRCLTIASEAVYWKSKMDPFNGGNASYADLAEDGMNKLFLDEDITNGTYEITNATVDELEVTAVSTSYPFIGVQVFVKGYDIDSTHIRFDGSITLP